MNFVQLISHLDLVSDAQEDHDLDQQDHDLGQQDDLSDVEDIENAYLEEWPAEQLAGDGRDEGDDDENGYSDQRYVLK